MNLIDRDVLRKKLAYMWYDNCNLTAKDIEKAIFDSPTVDAVSRALFEQVKWERDIAISQLNDYGVQFGEQVDVQAVRHGKWLKFIDNGIEYQTCSECNYDMPVGGADYWCQKCGAKMDGDFL